VSGLESVGADADRNHVFARAREESGFGMIELLIAIVILNIGVLAILAAFTSGSAAIKRASRIATASALADVQMELYRALKYNVIALDASSVAATDSTYRCDPVLGTACPNSTSSEVTTTCTTPLPPQCVASRPVTGADGGAYRVDTYITFQTPASGRVGKLVTIVVRDVHSSSRILVRESSTFDPATG
jgi:type II secretory pathway pseudopilin PulG